MKENEAPPRLVVTDHTLRRMSKPGAWKAVAYLKSYVRSMTSNYSDEENEYLSLQEHEHLLASAKAEGMAEAYKEVGQYFLRHPVGTLSEYFFGFYDRWAAKALAPEAGKEKP